MFAATTACFYGVTSLVGWHDAHPDLLALDARPPADHLARRIGRLVGLLGLAPLLRCHRRRGSDPFSPAPLLKAVLYEPHPKHLSPSAWHRHARENEPLRWLLRGPQPSRARRYASRDRLALLRADLNRQILQLAFDSGLSLGTRASLDGPSVAALGSRRRLDNRKSLSAKIEKLQAACGGDGKGLASPQKRPCWMAETSRGRSRRLRRFHQAEEMLQQRHQEDQQRRARDRVERKHVRACASEAEAALGRDKEGVYRPPYNEQIPRDLDSRLVLGHGVFAQASDSGTAAVPVGHYRRTFDGRLEVLLCDGARATGPQVSLMEHRDITLYAPLTPPVSQKGQMPRSAFEFKGGREGYVCPEGEKLQLVRTRTRQRAEGGRVGLKVYQAAAACGACERKQECCPRSKSGRTISRSEHEGASRRSQERMGTEEAKRRYKKRKETVELRFADEKEHRGLRRSRSRGLRRAGCQVGLLVLVHNGLLVQKAQSQASQPATEPASPT